MPILRMMSSTVALAACLLGAGCEPRASTSVSGTAVADVVAPPTPAQPALVTSSARMPNLLAEPPPSSPTVSMGNGTATGAIGNGTATGAIGNGTATGAIGNGTATGTIDTSTANGTVGAGTATGTVRNASTAAVGFATLDAGMVLLGDGGPGLSDGGVADGNGQPL